MKCFSISRFLVWAVLTVGACLFGGSASAADPDTTRIAFPVRQVAGYYSANFGELRTGHFHAGVDIKTDGVEGKPLVAVADGYISRAVITTYGYGRALYLTLKDGTTVVYGHLQRFRSDIADSLQADRYRRQSHQVDCSFPPDRWPVKRGEVIGYSGNSGSSGGPHLHFELREAGTGRRLDPVRAGWVHPKDHQAPRILRLHYVEVDSVQGVCVRSGVADYNVVRKSGGVYRLTRTEPVPVGRRGYFILEASDRRDDVHNTFGIWRLSGSLDGKPYFEYRMEGFRYEESRFCDAISSYALKRNSRNEVIRMACLERTLPSFYPLAVERGLVRTEPGEHRRMRIEVEDDCRNISTLEFEVVGRPNEFHAGVDSTSVRLSTDRTNYLTLAGHIRAEIPANALYESCFSRAERLPDLLPADSGLVVLSSAARVLPEEIPLHSEISIAMPVEVPTHLRLRTTLAAYTPGEKLRYAGGSYSGGCVTLKTRRTGWFVVVADTLPPKISPRFKEGEDLTKHSALRFAVSDRFSGVSRCTLRIDGRWVPCDRLPMKGLVFYTFDTPPEHRLHHWVFTATDAVGNSTSREGTFVR